MIGNGKAASSLIKHHSQQSGNISEFLDVTSTVSFSKYARLSVLFLTPRAFLRVNRQFFKEVIKLLYSQNTFSFELKVSDSTYIAPRVVFTTPYRDFTNGVMYIPEPEILTSDHWLVQVKEGISQILHRRPPLMLLPWIYADPFLRFLSTIGPENSACLRSLRFDEWGCFYCSCAQTASGLSILLVNELPWVYSRLLLALKFCVNCMIYRFLLMKC